MTIPSNVTRNSYTGTGITGPYPVTFKFFEDADLRVTVADTNGVETVKTLTTDYTVTGAGEQAGGSITFTAAVTNGYSIVIEPKADLTQDTDIKNEGGNLRESIEDRFDRLCRDDQVQQNSIDRSVKVQITDVSVADPVLPPREAGALIGWNDSGTGFANRAASLFSSDASITATGSTTARWISDRFADVVNVKDFGAVGDGVTDDTSAIQSAITAVGIGGGIILFPAGTFKVGPLFWASNVSAIFHPTCVISARSGFGVNDRLISMTNISNVTLHGNGARCVMAKADYSTGEQRHGVMILSCTNIHIYDLVSDDSGGDGFLIGAVSGSGVPSENVSLTNCRADNNRRQGLSITSGVNIAVIGGVYSNTVGTAPSAGIDIESDSSNDRLENILITGVKTQGNAGSGIIVVPQALGGATGAFVSLTIRDCVSVDDAANMGYEAGIRIDAASVPTYQIGGIIRVDGCSVINSYSTGIRIGGISWDKMPRLEVLNTKVVDPCAAGSPANIHEVAGVAMFQTFASGDVKDVIMRNVTVCDDRTVKKMIYPFLLWGDGSYKLARVSLFDCDDVSVSPIAAPYVMNNVAGTLLKISHAQPRTVSLAATDNFDRSASLICTHASSGVLTLPAAANYTGIEYTFYNSAGTTTQIRPATGDTILQDGQAANLDLVSRAPGDVVTLRSLGGTSWLVTSSNGRMSPLSDTVGVSKQMYWASGVPTTGTYAVGDKLFNSTPSVGNPRGWVCTVAGTPGTWVSEGNL